MYNKGNERGRQDISRGTPTLEDTKKIIDDARKFIIGENIDPESLLGYDGSVRKFADSKPDKNDTKSHQLRRFYSDIVDMWELAEKSSGDQNNPDVSKLRIRLAMMEARMNYAKERGVLSGNIFELLRECVSTVNRETGKKWIESLERFRTFFEAFVAYSYKGSEKHGGY